jgi:hypothetical protein
LLVLLDEHQAQWIVSINRLKVGKILEHSEGEGSDGLAVPTRWPASSRRLATSSGNAVTLGSQAIEPQSARPISLL